MTGVVTPYGVMELGLVAAVAPLWPAAGAAWIRPSLRRWPALCWIVYALALTSLALAIYGRVSGEQAIIGMPLMIVGLVYWFVFTQPASRDETTMSKGDAQN